MVPEWLKENEDYLPKKDKDFFIQKTIVEVLAMLSKIRDEKNIYDRRLKPSVVLVFTFIFVILLSLADNIIVMLAFMAVTLFRIVVLKPKDIGRVIIPALITALFSFFIMLPAFFMGQSYVFVRICLKVFISAATVNIIAVVYPFNEITWALKKLHVPSIFILTLDLTIKYIVILGDISLNMLNSLKLRSVGKNQKKASAAGGILGNTFLKSKEMAEETYQAMVCRGFDGEYK